MAGVFNALTTAVSGINAQADALTNSSNNIANSQTTGYKASTTSFSDFVAGNLRGNSESQAESNTVQAVSVQHVDNAGTATRSTNPLAMSISGNGMFVTAKPTGATANSSGETIFGSEQYYTRNGDFQQDKKGYLVNTSGYTLMGYSADKTGTLSTSLSPLNVANVGFNPTQTTTLNFNAAIGKLPADVTNYKQQSFGTNPSTTYDSSGNPHKVSTKWEESDSNPLVWNMSVYDADGTGTIAPNSYQVTFDSNGTLSSIQDNQTGKQVGSTIQGTSAEIPITAVYGANEKQTMNLNLGTIGGKTGATMVASTSTPTESQSNPLGSNGSTLSMASQSVIGTTTGSTQSYSTSPISVTANNVTKDVSLQWKQTSASPPTWNVKAVNPFDTSSQGQVSSDTHTVVFNSNGTIKTLDGASPGSNATFDMNIAGSNYKADITGATLTTNSSVSGNTTALTNDSVTNGNYTGVGISADGSVSAQFDNGYSQLIGKIPLAQFNNPNGLQAVDGQAYTATDKSGAPVTGLMGQNGSGTVSVGFTEGSTTDISGELSGLIVTQEAYSANTKIVTTGDQMLQSTIAMKQ